MKLREVKFCTAKTSQKSTRFPPAIRCCPMGEASRMRRHSNECSQDVRFVHIPVGQRDPPMSDQYCFSGAKLERIKSYFPLSHGRLSVDDRRMISRVVHVIRNGSIWRDAPEVYRPHKTPYNRFLRWSRIGVFWRLRRTSARLQACATASSAAREVQREDASRARLAPGH